MPYLHSIYLTDERDDSELPWRIDRNIESFRVYHPDFTHKLYRNEEARVFVERHFDRDVLFAYDELVPFSYKADLLRFCLLFELGGIYSDVSIHFFAPLETDTDAPKVKLFRDLFNHAPWIVCTSLIYAPAKVELFERCVRQIVENARSGYYGFDPLCPTGPNLLGAQVALWGKLDTLVAGDTRAVVRGNGGPVGGHVYVDADGTLVGVNGKRGSSLVSLGSKTRNNYNDYYYRRKIYRRELDRPDTWTHRDYRARQLINPVAVINEEQGRFLFPEGCAFHGPYVGLDAGNYAARFIFGPGDTEHPPADAMIDVVAEGEQVHVAQRAIPRPCSEGFELSLPFTLESYRQQVEIRLFLKREHELSFDRMELTAGNR